MINQEADPDRVRNELSQYGVISEDWGGDTQFISVSAKKGTGIDELLDAILLQAEVLELKAVYAGMASGVVVESYLDKGQPSCNNLSSRRYTEQRRYRPVWFRIWPYSCNA